ncbi:hypothetical protein DFH07DRAFT_547879 [Mycena maculata]|uniref:Uncharacterized protein n=1 Tax=Mycena maculata TaxID=230809 RepID=A0AAD7N7S9_9AGAR|nr:hypothetical protein DFH07DRAFT_547879 [Mycena maculata]
MKILVTQALFFVSARIRPIPYPRMRNADIPIRDTEVLHGGLIQMGPRTTQRGGDIFPTSYELSVMDNLQLADGMLLPMPIALDVS